MSLRPGLRVLLAACLALSVGYGVRQCLGLFIAPLEAARGWSAGTFALAFALQNLVWGLAQPFTGAVADRFGARLTVATGGLCYALGLGLMALTGSPALFAWGGGTLLGLALAATSFGVLIGPVAALVPPEKRSAAFGVLGAGGSLGQLFFPPFAQIGIHGAGWFPSLAVLALIGVAIVPLAFFLREPERAAHGAAHLSLGAALREAFSVPSYGLLSAGFFVCGFHIAFFQTHLPGIVARAGLSPGLGAAALAIVGAFNVIGSYASGRLADRFPKRYVLSSIYGLRFVAIGLFALLPITAVSVLVFSSAMGLLWLSTVAPTSGIIAEKFGMQWVSMLFGITFLSHQIGAFFGAWLGGVVLDRTGSYELMWVISLAVAAFAFLIQFPIDERPLARVRHRPRRRSGRARGAMSSAYEVVVVGAGPAGAAAALVLARLGRRVALVDKSAFPRDKPCGDLLGTWAVAALRGLGVAPPASAYRLRGAILFSPSGASVGAAVDPARCDARVVERTVFDASLVSAARAAGAAFVNARVTALREGTLSVAGDTVSSRADGMMSLTGDVVMPSRGRAMALQAPLVIGADGWGSVVGRAIGVRPPAHHGVALRAYAEGVDVRDGRMRFYVLPRGDGYGWIFPLGEGRANVGLGFVRGEPGSDRLHDAFARFTGSPRSLAAPLLRGATLSGVRAWPLAFGPRRAPASAAGVLLAGDAASLVSPLSGSGIHTALVSGIAAARIADAALRRGDVSRRALAGYDARLRRTLAPRLRAEALLHDLAGTPAARRRGGARAGRPRRRPAAGAVPAQPGLRFVAGGWDRTGSYGTVTGCSTCATNRSPRS